MNTKQFQFASDGWTTQVVFTNRIVELQLRKEAVHDLKISTQHARPDVGCKINTIKRIDSKDVLALAPCICGDRSFQLLD